MRLHTALAVSAHLAGCVAVDSFTLPWSSPASASCDDRDGNEAIAVGTAIRVDMRRFGRDPHDASRPSRSVSRISRGVLS